MPLAEEAVRLALLLVVVVLLVVFDFRPYLSTFLCLVYFIGDKLKSCCQRWHNTPVTLLFLLNVASAQAA